MLFHTVPLRLGRYVYRTAHSFSLSTSLIHTYNTHIINLILISRPRITPQQTNLITKPTYQHSPAKMQFTTIIASCMALVAAASAQ